MYLPHLQRSTNGLSIVVRASGDPLALSQFARSTVHEIDPAIPVTNIRTMDEVFSASVAQQRFAMMLIGLFGGLAVTLAAIGIYGVMGYAVSQRRHELAVRMALGARASQIRQLVLKDGALLATVGVGIGIGGAFALTRLMNSLLFEVKPTDVQTFISVAAFLIFVALLASYIPACRASKVDPSAALRAE
jgi:putative ABC transport system permease protein